jgi:hypothetical protein
MLSRSNTSSAVTAEAGLPLRSISLKVALYAAIRRVSAVGMSGAGAWF